MSNPYEAPHTPPAPSFPLEGRLRGKQWEVMIDGRSRTITLSHSRYGMATTVWVDEEVVYRSGNIFTVVEDADLPISIEGHDVLLVIRSTIWGSDYSILIDGQLIDGDYSDESDRRRRRSRAYFEACACLALGAVFMAVTMTMGRHPKPEVSGFPFAGAMLMGFGAIRLVFVAIKYR